MKIWQRFIGSTIFELRTSRGMTQKKLARKAGIHVSYVSDIEQGKRNPSLLVLVNIANTLGVEPAELLKRD